MPGGCSMTVCRIMFVAVACCTVLTIGCSKGANAPQLVPADGEVTYKGSPIAGATITFIPEKGPLAMAVTDLGGKFTLSTGSFPGVTAGPVSVSISAYTPGQGKSSDSAAVSKPPQSEAEAADYLKKAGQMQEAMNRGESAAASQPKSLIPERYTKAETSGLRFEVKASGENHFPIELLD
jgi:hypothetical protein